MAGGTPSGTIGTRISLDGSQPIETMKQLREAVKSLTNGWKAQEVELKSAGDYLNAAKARFDGLSESIKQQQGFIQRLKNEQNGLDTSTQEGSTRFAKLSEQINQATIKMGSMQGQLDRAKNSMNYYKSGIADLQSELKRTETVSASFVARLNAEGKASEAMKAKSDALHTSLSKMSELYTKQESELSRIASESGKGSDAYARQAIRVNELGTKMAKAQSEAKSLDRSISLEPHSWFGKMARGAQRLTGQLNKTEDAGKKTGSVFGATFLGNAVANGVSALASKLGDTAKQSIQLAQGGERASRAWETMGLSAKDVQLLQTQVGELRNKTGYSVDSVRALQKSFYGLTGNAKDTDKLTKSIVGMQSAAGLSESSLSRVGKQLGRMTGSASVSAQQFKRLTQLAPNMGNELAKAAGMPRKAFDQMVASGKLTGKQLLDLSEKASSQADGNFKELNKTSEGAMNQIKGSWTSMKSEFGSKLINVQTTGLGDLANVMQSPAMKAAVDSLAKGIGELATRASKLIGYLSGHQKDIGGVITSLTTITKLLFDGAWKAVSGTINGIGNAFSSLTGNAKKSTDPVKNLNRLLIGLAKHQDAIKGIGAALVGAFAAAKLMSGITGIAKGISALTIGMKGYTDAAKITAVTQKALNIAMKANLFVAIAAAVVAVGVALFELYKHNKKFRDFINGIGKAFKKGFDGMVKVAKKSIDAIGKFFTGKLGWEKAIGNEVGKVGKAISSGFTTTINWIKKNWGGLALLLVNPFAGAIKLLYNNNKGFKKWADDLVKGVVNVFKKLSKDLSAIWNGIKKVAGVVWKGIEIAALAPIVLLAAEIVAVWKRIQKPIEAIWNGMKSTAQTVWKGISNAIIQPVVNVYKQVSKFFGQIASFIGRMWNAVWRDTVNCWAAIGRAISKPVQDVFNFVSKIWNSLSKWISNTWNDIAHFTSNIWNGIWRTVSNFASNLWHDVTKIFNRLGSDVVGIWNNIKKWTSDAWNAVVVFVSKPVDAVWNKVTSVFGKMSSWIGDTLGTIKSVWHNTWSDVGSFFGGIWDGIQKAGKSGINGVIDFLNGGINGIDSVISFLGGKKKAIGDIPKLAVGTMNGRLVKDTLAILNDGHDSPETGNKEMVIKKDGRMGIVQGQDTLTHLDAGDAVLNARDTKDIMYSMGIPHFATGSGWLDNIKGAINWVGGKFDDVGKWIGDKAKAIENFMKHPIDEVTKVFDKFTSGFKDTSELIADMASPAGHFVIKQGEKWFKDLFSGLNDDQGDAGGGKGAPSGAGVQRWRDQVKQALAANNLSTSDSMIERILRQIATESSGNEKASQHGDPDGDGSGPAMGLMQTKRNTFNHYAFPGHKDIWNGYDSLLAGLAYAKATYGPSLSFLGNGHGYANGGLISKHGMYEVSENNLSEMIIPMSSVKSSRGYELLGKAAATMAARDGMGGTNDGNQAELELMQQQNSLLQGQVKRLDNIIDLFSGLFTGNGSLSALVNLIDKQRYANMTTQKPQRLGLEGI